MQGDAQQPVPQQEAGIVSQSPLVPSAREEPLWLLLLGILMFLGLVYLSWSHGMPRTTTPDLLASASARQGTYLVAWLEYASRQTSGATQPFLAAQLRPLAMQTARAWETVSRDVDTPRDKALTAVNAAALHGVAGQDTNARDALRDAAAVDPERQDIYQALEPLYARMPQPVSWSLATAAVLETISAGPLLRARNAELRGDRAAAAAALEPGARAGRRVLLVNGLIAVLLFALFITAVIIALSQSSRIARAVETAAQAGESDVPWGIGTALIVITLTYLLASFLAPLAATMLRHTTAGVNLVLGVLGIIVSALIVLGFLLLALERMPWEWHLFGWQPTRHGIRRGIGALVLLFPVVLGLTALSQKLFGGQQSPSPLIPELLTSDSVLFRLFLVLTATFMAPLVEETLFRGILFRAATVRLPFWGAALGSALLFALVHGLMVGILPITLLGLLFAFLTRQSRSLVPAAAAHATYNGLVTLMVLATAWTLQGPGG